MAVIRTILKSSPYANGRHQVLLMLSERGTRSYFTTGFTADLKEFDTSKEGGRFHQGRGVRSFTLERKEEDGSTKSYTNKGSKRAPCKFGTSRRTDIEILQRFSSELEF